MKIIRYLFIFFFAISAYGCGYHTLGKGDNPALSGINSLAIPVFKNDTYRPDVESVITTAIVDEFVNIFDVADSGRADAVLYGTVIAYELTPVSYSSKAVIREYRLTIVISIKVLRKSDGVVLWEDKNIRDYEDFTVDTDALMATKDAERSALVKISSDTARLVREHMLEGF
ncbi:MAG: hypothetical protein HY883_06630 [Deltaproteobacteria bacterium]|nr:hypothetical protein [Deltaproteobacteria bacterium]